MKPGSRADAIGLALFCALVAVMTVVQSRGTAQEQPAAGDRRGNRCYDGRMWLDCGTTAPAPAHVMRSWSLATVNYARVSVISTEGVCLYVVSGGEPGAYNQTPVSIAAVPKMHLPEGAGCQ